MSIVELDAAAHGSNLNCDTEFMLGHLSMPDFRFL